MNGQPYDATKDRKLLLHLMRLGMIQIAQNYPNVCKAITASWNAENEAATSAEAALKAMIASRENAGKMDFSTATGIELIAAERQRQIEVEGWTPEHDDTHDRGEMAMAGACYAMPPNMRKWGQLVDILWPQKWALHWWKPTPDDRVRELVKAGALIAAEIDRLRRAAARAGEGKEE